MSYSNFKKLQDNLADFEPILIRLFRPTSRRVSWELNRPLNQTPEEEMAYTKFVDNYFLEDSLKYINELKVEKTWHTDKRSKKSRIRLNEISKEIEYYRLRIKETRAKLATTQQSSPQAS